jgi:DNA-binding transcriptional regulator YiaG
MSVLRELPFMSLASALQDFIFSPVRVAPNCSTHQAIPQSSDSGWHNPCMSNVASLLKNEISRIAKKEVRAEVQTLKKTSAHHRSQIAALKRGVADLERRLQQATKQRRGPRDSVASESDSEPRRRFSAKRLAAHRAKLGLSAENYGRLCGVSGQTIYKWEQESARPRAAQLQALAAVRGLGIREVQARLNEAPG